MNALLAGVDDLVEDLTRWFIANPSDESIQARIDRYRAGFDQLSTGIRTMGPKRWQNRMERTVARLVRSGVPEPIAVGHAFQVELAHAADIIDVSALTGRPLDDVGRLFFRAGTVFHFDWLERQLAALPQSTRWQRWAAIGLERELMALRRSIVESVLEASDDVPIDDAIEAFFVDAHIAVDRLNELVTALRKEGVSDTAPIIVAMRQLEGLVR